MRIPQPMAKAAAVRVLAHLQVESRTGIAFEFTSRPPKLPTLVLTWDRQRELRAALYEATDGRCGLCGEPIARLSDATIDHVVPRSRGGGNYANLLPAHGRCNNRKGDREPTACELIALSAVNARRGEAALRSAGSFQVGAQRASLAGAFAAAGVA